MVFERVCEVCSRWMRDSMSESDLGSDISDGSLLLSVKVIVVEDDMRARCCNHNLNELRVKLCSI